MVAPRTVKRCLVLSTDAQHQLCSQGSDQRSCRPAGHRCPSVPAGSVFCSALAAAVAAQAERVARQTQPGGARVFPRQSQGFFFFLNYFYVIWLVVFFETSENIYRILKYEAYLKT